MKNGRKIILLLNLNILNTIYFRRNYKRRTGRNSFQSCNEKQSDAVKIKFNLYFFIKECGNSLRRIFQENNSLFQNRYLPRI